MECNVKVMPSGVTYKTKKNILSDAIAQSVNLEYSCKTGSCKVCLSEVISGSVENEYGEVVNEKSFVLICRSKALTDIVLKANYYPELELIKERNFPGKINSIDFMTDDIAVLKVRYPKSLILDYLPGQYVDLKINGVKRSYSIANAKAENSELEFHIRRVPDGIMSDLIFGRVQENHLIQIEGPKGTFFIRKSDKRLILMCTGTGVAPIKAIIESLIQLGDKREIHIYWGMRYKKELYSNIFYDFEKSNLNIHYTPVLSREKNGNECKGYIQNAVANDFLTLQDCEVYACGSLDMINEARELFLDKQLSPEAFHSDAFVAAYDSGLMEGVEI